MRTISIISAASLLLAGVPAAAQQGWTSLRELLLEQATTTMAGKGFLPEGDLYEGSLDDDGTERIDLTLDRGVEIVLLGFCDYDCKDLDLTLYDEAGNEVTTDVLTDDAPLLQLTPTSKGNDRLVVTMAICNDEPCRYGVQAFE